MAFACVQVHPGLTSWATFSRPLRQAQGRLCGTDRDLVIADLNSATLSKSTDRKKANLDKSGVGITLCLPARTCPHLIGREVSIAPEISAGINCGHYATGLEDE